MAEVGMSMEVLLRFAGGTPSPVAEVQVPIKVRAEPDGLLGSDRLFVVVDPDRLQADVRAALHEVADRLPLILGDADPAPAAVDDGNGAEADVCCGLRNGCGIACSDCPLG